MAASWSTPLVDWAWLGPSLDVRTLFPVERGALLDLLEALDSADWGRSTVCPGWDVHDVVGHIVHDYIRRLSGGRDGHLIPHSDTTETLPAFLARANEEFVSTARQFSPRLMIDLLASLGPQVDAFWAGCDLTAPAGLDVSWAAPACQPRPGWTSPARHRVLGPPTADP